MKTAAISLALIANCIAGPAKAAETELRSLADVLENETSTSTMLYAFERCAALYYAVHEYSNNSPNKDPEVLGKLIELSSNFISVSSQAISEIREIDETEAQQVALNAISGMVDLYIARMNNYYLKSGEAFDELVKSDLVVCGKLAEAS